MEICLNAKKVLGECLANNLGLEKYAYIMKNFQSINISKDECFQKTYNSFYKVRRDADWRKIYYNLFENLKTKQISFEDVITYLYKKTGNVEASFSSKMLATIFPEKPIWDHHVLKNLGFCIKTGDCRERLRESVSIYTGIEDWYKDYLDTNNALKSIRCFDNYLPAYSWISNTKKIDFLLWEKR